MSETQIFFVFILIVVVFVIKEVASYRLSAKHPLNRFLNSPSDRRNNDGVHSIELGDGDCGGD